MPYICPLGRHLNFTGCVQHTSASAGLSLRTQELTALFLGVRLVCRYMLQVAPDHVRKASLLCADAATVSPLLTYTCPGTAFTSANVEYAMYFTICLHNTLFDCFVMLAHIHAIHFTRNLTQTASKYNKVK